MSDSHQPIKWCMTSLRVRNFWITLKYFGCIGVFCKLFFFVSFFIFRGAISAVSWYRLCCWTQKLCNFNSGWSIHQSKSCSSDSESSWNDPGELPAFYCIKNTLCWQLSLPWQYSWSRTIDHLLSLVLIFYLVIYIFFWGTCLLRNLVA